MFLWIMFLWIMFLQIILHCLAMQVHCSNDEYTLIYQILKLTTIAIYIVL